MSVTRPTFMLLPAVPDVLVVVFAEDLFPLPPQPATTRSTRTPRSASDRFILSFPLRFATMGRKL